MIRPPCGPNLSTVTAAASAQQYEAGQPRPLILTLQLDADTQRRFDDERRMHFPPGRTAVVAHVTLFHALQGADEPAIADVLVDTVAGIVAFDVSVRMPVSLGNGAAYPLASPTLHAMHRELQHRWWSSLTRQDQQGFRAHVTVQNKVSAEVARRTLAELRAAFVPFSCTAVGIRLWRYDGGPWTARGTYPFQSVVV